MIPTWPQDDSDENAQDTAEMFERPATHFCPTCQAQCRCFEGTDLPSRCIHAC